MNLQERFAETITKAQQALEAGELDEGKRLRGEAETLKSALEELEAIQGMKAMASPVRPPMPGAAIAPQPAEKGDPAVKAFYMARFGEPDAAIKAVLTDLYGASYDEMFWTQKRAFNAYLRSNPQKALPAWVENASRQLVLTPQAVKEALAEGLDVAALKTTMVESSDTLGGYIVPVDFQASVIERLRGLTVMRGRANTVQTSRDAIEMPVATGGDAQYSSAVRVTWVDEVPTSGAAATNLTFGQERLPIHTVMAETTLSRNLIEDAAFPLEAYLARKFAEAAAIDEDNQFLTGDGNGKPQGVLPGSANGLSLTEVNSGNANYLTFDGLIGLTFGLSAQYRQNAVFVAEKATWRDIAKLQDGNGQYLWRDMFGNNQGTGGAGRMPTLLGYPVLEQEALPTIAANAFPVVFGDLNGYTIADRVGMSVERYLDSTTARTNTVIYVMRRRLGGQVTESWRFVVQKVSA
jgi:HK97 family phage major capsid protein